MYIYRYIYMCVCVCVCQYADLLNSVFVSVFVFANQGASVGLFARCESFPVENELMLDGQLWMCKRGASVLAVSHTDLCSF